MKIKHALPLLLFLFCVFSIYAFFVRSTISSKEVETYIAKVNGFKDVTIEYQYEDSNYSYLIYSHNANEELPLYGFCYFKKIATRFILEGGNNKLISAKIFSPYDKNTQTIVVYGTNLDNIVSSYKLTYGTEEISTSEIDNKFFIFPTFIEGRRRPIDIKFYNSEGVNITKKILDEY